jgi:hypothetical protein
MNAIKFNNISTAKGFHYCMNEYSKHTIIMGDDGLFWIVTNRQASALVKAGYEIAE